jgi:hypothetical protein
MAHQKPLKFLNLIRPKGGFINLVAIHPTTGKITAVTRNVSSPDIPNFLQAYIPTHNLYYTLNEPSKEAPDNKLTKQHIKRLYGLYIDIDPRKGFDFESERKRLKELSLKLQSDPLPPTYTIDSGSGHQMLWLLNEPIEATQENRILFEEYGRGLAKKFSSDPVQNIDRLLRLPFTNNFATPKKKKIGRSDTQSTVIHASQKHFQWNTLKDICEPEPAPEYDSTEDYDLDFAMLKEIKSWDNVPILKDRFNVLKQENPKLNKLITGQISKPSRSEYDFMLCSILKSEGWNIQETAIALWLFEYGKGTESTKREIIRAYARAENPFEQLALPDTEIERIESQKNPIEQYKNFGHSDTYLTQEGGSGADGNKNNGKRVRKAKPPSQMSWKDSGKPLVKGFIKQGTLVALYGQSNVGKSFLAADIAGHIALGKEYWGNYKIKGEHSVLYVAAEAGNTFGERIDGLKMKFGLPWNVEEKDFPLTTYDEIINLHRTDKETGYCEGVDTLIFEAEELGKASGKKCGLIVVDTLSAVFGGGGENSPDDMGQLVNNLLIIAKKTGATIILIHHSGKDEKAGLRGHTKLIGGIDTSIELRSVERQGKEIKEFSTPKQRSDRKAYKNKFILDVIELGKDEDGDPVTTCSVILESDENMIDVFPDKLDELNLDELLLYTSLILSTNLYKNNEIQNYYTHSIYQNFIKKGFVDKDQAIEYFKGQIGINYDKVCQFNDENDLSFLPISYRSGCAFYKKLMNFDEVKMKKLGIVRNVKKQWFIENDENE